MENCEERGRGAPRSRSKRRCAVAAADVLTVAHPGDRATAALVTLALGGTALFLAGHALFKWAIFGVLSWLRVVAIAALIALVPVGFEVPAIALSGVAGLVVVGFVAVLFTLAHRG